ncbi:hypothetical protein I862_04255 [endosymbiont of Acanthamoeba sp. UWC8]|uniref:DUF3800 domain-containing protein n=1 Tax=endosymbiont of Acanthamoeba sp. UWC8 TaxID=86106 RepID=UPI0004D1E811|nr:DUF3800 domain-containing protein [endosymbiont of Acanthamoeba sp. UWC8]AIF81411.1 hypothetical protein I862_04255 [endosymbiont of Acanthamoeba sp. UWC8]
MAYIFMDESGCLGFNFSKPKTSKHFIISFLFCTNKRPIEKVVKKIFQSFPQKERKSCSGVLHCNKESPKTRIKLFNSLKELEITVMFIRLNKNKVYTNLHNEKPVLYNYVTNILLDRIFSKKLIPTNEKIFLIASRRETNYFLNENFKNYIKSKNHADIEVIIKTPAQEKALQAADFISWAAFRKYERNDESYYTLIKKLIIEDCPLFG